MFGNNFPLNKIDNQSPIETATSFFSDSLVSINTLVRALMSRLAHGFEKIRLNIEKNRIKLEM